MDARMDGLASVTQFSLLTLIRRRMRRGRTDACPSPPQHTRDTLLDWLRMEYAIEKPSNKLLTLAELDSNTWVSEVKRIRGKKQPLTAAGLHALRNVSPHYSPALWAADPLPEIGRAS